MIVPLILHLPFFIKRLTYQKSAIEVIPQADAERRSCKAVLAAFPNPHFAFRQASLNDIISHSSVS